MANNSIFAKFLDNAPDALTLEIEISPLASFQTLYEMMQESDSNDTRILERLGVDDLLVQESQQTLFDLIRHIWDIAYSHGEHDALAEVGATLKEMED